MNQKQYFYQSHCIQASTNHLKMAKLQRKAGREDLAIQSERIALARRITSQNLTNNFAEDLKVGEAYSQTNLI